MKSQSDIKLSVDVEYDRGEEKLPVPDAFVVAFDDTGDKIASATVKKGCADLKLPACTAGQTIRIFHASTGFNLKETSSIARLQRYLAVEKRYFVNPDANDLRVVLPKLNLTYWLSACCRVKGKVMLRIRMPNGKTRYAPLCNARVQIYEVDHTFPMLIKALPDHLIYRMRDEWKAAIQNPVVQAETRPAAAAIGEGLRQAFTTLDDTQCVKPQTELRKRLEPVFNLKTAAPLRKAIINNFTLLRPYLCLFDWLPFHDLDLLKTVDIAADGAFDTHIYYPCFGDKPDLYFKVQQDCHKDGWLTVYAPSIHCSTYWNYCCGTEVNIQVSNPEAASGLSVPVCNFPGGADDPASIGAVEEVEGADMPFGIANAALLHTGKVLFLPAENIKESTVWTPGEVGIAGFERPSPDVDERLWCSGHAFLDDGRLLVMGGGGSGPSAAVDRVWTFDPHSENWTLVASMDNKRWYPTGVLLPDGRVVVFSGWDSTPGAPKYNIDTVEIYDPASNTWDDVSGAERIMNGTYPGLHLLPSGEIIFTRTGFRTHTASPADKSANLLLTDAGAGMSGTWEDEYLMSCPDRREGMSVMLLREYTEAEETPEAPEPAPLDPPIPYARILVVGGGKPPVESCKKSVEMIDLPVLSGTPEWKKAADLHYDRVNVNVVLLPDDTVLVCGGAPAGTPCEIYHPDHDIWHDAAPLEFTRGYHSTALLLPDATVLVADWNSGRMELYSPPYLFRGPRPTYTLPDHHIHHDAEFSIYSPDACRIKKMGFMRPSAVTHHTDPEQRYIPLHFDRHGKCELRIRAPKSGTIAPPGYYMLFIVDDCGIPSEARFIQLH